MDRIQRFFRESCSFRSCAAFRFARDRERFVTAIATGTLAIAGATGAGAIAPGDHASLAAATRAPRIELPARPPAFVESRGSAARALQTQTGSRWEIGWHPWLDLARHGQGGRPRGAQRPAEAQLRSVADGFVRTHARLLGAEGATLRPVRWRHAGRAWHATWQQELEGRRVLGGILDLTLLEDGTVVAFRSQVLPQLRVLRGAPDLDVARATCAARVGSALTVVAHEPVWVVETRGPEHVVLDAWQLVLRGPHGARWRAVVGGADARVLQLESMVRTSQLTGSTSARIKPHYALDPYVDVHLPWLQIHLGFAETDPSTFADDRGLFQFVYPEGQVTLRSSLTGRYVTVDNETDDPAPYFEAEVAVPGNVEVRFGAVQSRNDERTIYHHVNLIHDFAARFDFSLLDYPVPALAGARDPHTGDPNYPNAYWDGQKLGFGNGGGTFRNMGLYEDVVYHEYTHAITQFMYEPAGDLIGAIGGAMHEGLADYFAATITNDSRLGENLGRHTDLPLRNLENRLVWPDHRDDFDQVHANGEIFGGALWEVRQAVGPDVADAVIHFARELFPRNFDEYLDAMLLQDDLLFGDGWPGNGSPHRDPLMHAFALHGIGPLRDDALEIVHIPLGDTDDARAPRRVHASVRARLKNPEPFVRLSYRLAGDEEFVHAWMLPDHAGGFSAEIPAFPMGSDVEYFVAAGQYEPAVRVGYLPLGSPEEVFRYHVGPDTEPPTITHAARATVAAFAWPPELRVRIDDNVGVAYAFVEYRINGHPGATLGLVRSTDDPGVYWTRFPDVGGAPGDLVAYAITAVDASQESHATRFPPTGSVQMAIVDDLLEDFEHDQSTWRHGSIVTPQSDAWQRTTRWNHTPGGTTAWLCGAPDGDYPLGVAAELVTDWYRVDAGAVARVWSWMDAREAAPGVGIDGGRVEIQSRTDDAWVVLEPRGGYTHAMGIEAATSALVPGAPGLSGRDAAWRALEFDLDAWARQRVRLRFLFGSTHEDAAGAGRGRGWLLDDFEIAAGEVDPTDTEGAPQIQVLRVHAAPNPFNPRVRLRLEVPRQAGALRLDIVDARGRLVRRLLDGVVEPGVQDLVWDGQDASGLASASGVYYYRLHSKLGLETGKLVLVR